jgi:GNAT superfamily N-acetyltransferase
MSLTAPSATLWQQHRAEYTVSTDPSRMDIAVIHGYLSRAYWCEGIPRDVVERSMRNSLCFGLFKGEEQIGFARVITDYATYAYICDVFVLEAHSGHGLGAWLMQCVMRHPKLQGLRRWSLVTRDAHEFYREVGFTALAKPQSYMELHTPDIYKFPEP